MGNLVHDEEKQYDVSALKKRLLDYRELEIDIDNQIERIENLESKMKSVSSPEFSDMPKTHNSPGDRMGNYIVKKEEILETIDGLMKQRDVERSWILCVLEHLKKANEKAVIEMRYLDGESWKRVSQMLFSNREDYMDREDSYIRQTTKLHGKALMNMAMYISSEESV